MTAERKKEITEQRRTFRTGLAPKLATQAECPTTPAKARPGTNLSDAMCFFADAGRMVVVVGQHEMDGDLGLALSYGLHHAHGRPLTLILPKDSEGPTLQRLAWLEAPVTVWTHDGAGNTRKCRPASRQEILKGIDDDLEEGAADLSGREVWIAELLDWARAESNLTHINRKSYVAWHCRGRQVLAIQRTGKGLSITAGVNYKKPTLDKPDHKKPTLDRPKPVVELVTSSITGDQLSRIRTAVEAAVRGELAGNDATNEEHRLQHALASNVGLLNLREVRREFPAARPGTPRAYIDFLGLDASGGLHIIETKIGEDAMIVLQGLDYWVWVSAHIKELERYFGVPKFSSIAVDFVVGPKKKANALVDDYTITLASVLCAEVSWRFHRVEGWRTPPPTVVPLGMRAVPNRRLISE